MFNNLGGTSLLVHNPMLLITQTFSCRGPIRLRTIHKWADNETKKIVFVLQPVPPVVSLPQHILLQLTMRFSFVIAALGLAASFAMADTNPCPAGSSLERNGNSCRCENNNGNVVSTSLSVLAQHT